MNEMEIKLEKHLEVLRDNIDIATEAYYTRKAIAVAVKRSRRSRRMFLRLVEHRDFWRVVFYSIQCTYFISLAKVFDHKNRYSIQKLLEFCQSHLEIFSRDALARRRQDGFGSRKELEAYVRNTYVPTESDFRKLKRPLRRRENKAKPYIEIRNKVFGHPVLTSIADIEKAFKKTDVKGIEDMLLFTQRFHSAIRGLFENGNKPVLGRQQLTLKHRITRETHKFLNCIRDT